MLVMHVGYCSALGEDHACLLCIVQRLMLMLHASLVLESLPLIISRKMALLDSVKKTLARMGNPEVLGCPEALSSLHGDRMEKKQYCLMLRSSLTKPSHT
jgi:hypothetical protein